MFRVTKANFTRTLLLSMINDESMHYIKIRSKSKINGKNAKEIISTFGSYEIQIDNPLIVGTPRRSGRVRTKKKMNSIEKKEEEDTEFEYETPSDINNYVSGLKRRKVLFSKNKLKHAMKANIVTSSIANLSKATSKDFLDSSDTNNSISVNQIKKGMVILRKMAYRLKKKKKEVHIDESSKPKSPTNKPKIRRMINPKKLKSSTNFSFNNKDEVDNPLKHSQIYYETSSKKKTKKLSHKLLFGSNNNINNNPLSNSMISNDIKTERIVNEICFNDDSSVSD